MATLTITNVSKTYPGGAGVQNVNLKIGDGELVSLLGPSGCGKTTLLRLIGGFHEPDDGDIFIDDVSVVGVPPERRPTAMVFQQFNLWPHMTVYENLAFGLKLRRLPKTEIRKQVMDALELVRLANLADRRTSELSGGQQQRVAVARAVVLRPKVLLLDEPFSSLDAKLRIALREELRRIQQETKTTMVFVTHDQEEALFLSDRIAVMNNGRIEQTATPVELYDNPQSLFVARFIGEMNCLPISKEKSFWRELLQDKPLPSGPAICAVRPEHVELCSEPSPIRGRVERQVVAGHYVQLYLQTNVGTLICHQFREGGDVWPDGEIYVRFRKTAVFEGSV